MKQIPLIFTSNTTYNSVDYGPDFNQEPVEVTEDWAKVFLTQGRAKHADQELEAEKVEAEKVEAEKVEAEKVEAERLEAERLEAEKVENVPEAKKKK
jgi:hypothetical protein